MSSSKQPLTHAPSAEEIRADIEWSADLELARRSAAAVIAYPVLAILVVISTPLYRDFPVGSWVFLGLCLMGTASRLWLVAGYPKRKNQAQRARRLFDLGAVCMSALWGLFCAFVLLHYGESWPLFLALIYTAGLGAGGTATLCVRLLSLRCYLAALFLPTVAVAIASDIPYGARLAAAVCVYAVFLLVQGTQLHRRYWFGLRQREDLRNASNAKTEFLAHMSHEIRTPMSCVLGMTQLMLGMTDSPQQRSHLRVIESSSETMMRIINDLLDLSKAESGHMELDVSTFPLRTLVEEVTHAFQTAALRNGISLRCEFGQGVPLHVAGDDGRLRQVLMNLLSNAVKFTQEGQVVLRVQPLEGGPEGAPRWKFEVQDSGVGVPVDRRDAIFEAFTQADASTTRRFGGTGLGLSISASLLNLMGGELTLESEEHVGSLFRFDIAMDVVTKHDIVSPEPLSPRRDVGPGAKEVNHEAYFRTRTRSLSILLAEDNEDNAIIQRQLLSMRGHQVTWARDGRQAFESYSDLENQYDVILLDLQMPGVDGFEAARAIRELQVTENRVHTPIVALTAHALKSYEERAYSAGMDGFLTKPVHVPDLLQLMERLAPPRPVQPVASSLS